MAWANLFARVSSMNRTGKLTLAHAARQYKREASPVVITGDRRHSPCGLGRTRYRCRPRVCHRGRLAQLARAPPLQGGSHRFKSCIAQSRKLPAPKACGFFFSSGFRRSRRNSAFGVSLVSSILSFSKMSSARVSVGPDVISDALPNTTSKAVNSPISLAAAIDGRPSWRSPTYQAS